MTLPVRSTLVPVIFVSYATPLTNLSGDGKLWPIHMSIGNIPSSIRQKSKQCAWVLIALLLVGPKQVHKKAGWSAAQQKRESLETTNNLLRHILNPTSEATWDGITTWCGDGMKGKSYIRVVAWLAHHIENCTIIAVYNTRCCICECLADELGDHTKSYPPRDHKSYAEWVKNTNTEKLKAAGVKVALNALWTL